MLTPNETVIAMIVVIRTTDRCIPGSRLPPPASAAPPGAPRPIRDRSAPRGDDSRKSDTVGRTATPPGPLPGLRAPVDASGRGGKGPIPVSAGKSGTSGHPAAFFSSRWIASPAST